ncbi:nucleoid-associated protein, YbaB/EbfC family [Candidatus Uhrbacteria bacterium CG22_combo_CG10-13_8_21_14_all_47_17]|uniref:Nucleoid-associated protein COX00_04450 n=1 Tax=Candidatus Uhrbacteria bacterium CG22_combo_CG10-13_8_21_14_all_47_17 TaxID=1975041 RepID=A0A2H0BRH3_9BACT|nr:MAG: nucleoid-associated protein, YbaB/EbfC family [Candidatus Uhrbacteria bacterium CG22_combo_CG10-13_8_21_14_all_47_17]
MTSMFNKLKQFKDLKTRAKDIQSTLAQESAEGTGGWGKVKVKIDGNQQVLSVTIDPEALNDKTKLEQWIREAMNDGVKKIQQIMARKLKDVGGLDLASEFSDIMKK